jgi:hypothetical protein
MHRLEDPGHAADADAVEQLVLVEVVVVGEPLEQPASLVLGDVLVGDQPPGERLGVGVRGGLAAPALLEGLDVLGG